ncbi:uncharacterized protein A1O5_07758 [Cladophialophora psammophila CBS 110553]|uniref:Peptidase S8/S53 domain-containing protein n=1 Tax=Cladophialophora psammophila CBS 110553 TaxID=1182543 RepID=W9WVY8_9EURO|nr:uncharacterized protein A1O5_07758 [Cladophialophora psammophila CBS 110553]EXJ68826.1 hypothetical protein A1O5_07758 [Cladophialophora psammophila CBS 110553]
MEHTSTQRSQIDDNQDDEGEFVIGDYLDLPGEQKEIRAIFDDIVERARSNKLNLGDEANRRRFRKENGGQWLLNAEDNKSLLHLLAYSSASRDCLLLSFMLINEDSDILSWQDDYKRTPFHAAISRKNYIWLFHVGDYICAQKGWDLDNFLRVTSDDTGNCLHAAFKLASPELKYYVKAISLMVDHASRSTLRSQDERGYTPLHHAVAFKNCTKDQVQIVQKLLEREGKALDCVTAGPKRMSPYQYHVSTRHEAQPRAQDEFPTQPQDEFPTQPQDEFQASQPFLHGNIQPDTGLQKLAIRGDVIDNVTSSPLGIDSGTGASKLPSLEMPTIYNVGQPKKTQPSLEIDQPRSSVVPTAGPMASLQADSSSTLKSMDKLLLRPKVLDTALRTGGGIQAHPLLSQSIPFKERRGSITSTTLVTEESADEMKRMLELYCLRNRSPAQASKILYGRNVDDKQICFEYFEAPEEIVAKDFKITFNHVHFNNILQYVAIPHIKVDLDDNEAKSVAGPGRRDAVFFLRWLRGRGVKQVLRVIVDDLPQSGPLPAHDDETIEEVLNGLGVEELDWKKLDLCPETIGCVGTQLEKVHLYWGGSNAVLRGWSEQSGLAALDHLTNKPRMKQKDGRTSRQSENIKKFQQRLETYTREKKIKVRVVDDQRYLKRGEIMPPSRTGDDTEAEPHRWIESMKQFAEVIINMPHPNTDDKKIPPQLKQDIKIAIIDDGADISQLQLRGNVVGGQTLYQEENRQHPYWFSSSGHGTAMASLVQQVFPLVKLYIFRLESHFSESGNKLSIKSETAAIKLAIAHHVDIISMSWSLQPKDDDEETRKSLEDAVGEAFNNHILMFCSAADAGDTKKDSYPSYYCRDKIIRIGAADAAERSSKWVGDRKSVDFDFLLPGVKVKHYVSAGLQMKDSHCILDGSSIATALAAGLAGLILYCVQLAAICTHANEEEPTPTALTVKDYEKLKSLEVMKNAFENIGVNDQFFIEIWHQFDPAAQKIENSHFNKVKWSAVAAMARNLINKH